MLGGSAHSEASTLDRRESRVHRAQRPVVFASEGVRDGEVVPSCRQSDIADQLDRRA